jgi:hypothetical protein
MTFFIIIFSAVVILFGFVILFGAPYLPTLKSQQTEALKLLALQPGQTLLELGSGDGRMLKAAAKLGVKSIGYELNPLLVLYSKLVCYRYRQLVTIRWGNFWQIKLPACNGIYVFLLDRYMGKLHNKITQEKLSNVKLVSYAFRVPGKKALTETNALFLYEYPAKK